MLLGALTDHHMSWRWEQKLGVRGVDGHKERARSLGGCICKCEGINHTLTKLLETPEGRMEKEGTGWAGTSPENSVSCKHLPSNADRRYRSIWGGFWNGVTTFKTLEIQPTSMTLGAVAQKLHLLLLNIDSAII